MANFNDLQQRLITGAVFVAVVIGVGYFGGFLGFSALFCLLMAIVAYEWAKLCNLNEKNAIIYALGFILTIAVVIFIPITYLILVLLTPILIASHLKWKNNKLGLVAGVSYLSVATSYLFYSMKTETWWFGIFTIWLSVIAVDVGAYIVGRIIGGKKLAPSISPGKTISGFVGGVLFGAIAFTYLVSTVIVTELQDIFLIGAVMSVMAQLGDLYQSFMKRRVGAKDSGKILPGHGGMFDRLDGLIMVLAFIPVASLVYKVIVG